MSSALLSQFVTRAEQAGSKVHSLGAWSDVAKLAVDLSDEQPVAVSQRLAEARAELAAALGDRLLLSSDAHATAAARVGIVAGVLGVAETGSVLVSETTEAERCVSLLPRRIVQVLRADRVLRSLDDVGQWLSEHHHEHPYAVLETGPSRTADIERSLTIGVQGPEEVHVVLLD